MPTHQKCRIGRVTKRHEPGMNGGEERLVGDVNLNEMVKKKEINNVDLYVRFFFLSLRVEIFDNKVDTKKEQTKKKKKRFQICFRTKISCISAMVRAESTN